MDPRVKRIVGEIAKDPWTAILWPSSHRVEVVRELDKLIDDAIFELDVSRALDLAVFFRGSAKKIQEHHLQCKAEACLGSVFRLLGCYDRADEQLRRAALLAAGCDECACGVYKRWAVLRVYQNLLGEALSFSDRALTHAEAVESAAEKCGCLLSRSAIYRLTGHADEGFEIVRHATTLLAGNMPSRFFVAAAVNALSLAVAIGEKEKISAALAIVDAVRYKAQGSRSHSRALPILRWVRGLAFDRVANAKEAVRSIESAIAALDRLGMIEEKKAAMADLARIRRKGKQAETNDRHILRLIDECSRLERDLDRLEILGRARRDPSEENILAWRSTVMTCVPILEPVSENGAIV